MTLARAIQRRIDANGWTTAHLARYIGVSAAYLEDAMRGTVEVTDKLAGLLASALGETRDWWLGLR
jgi:plasmid maintenance system antidote protein VapI